MLLLLPVADLFLSVCVLCVNIAALDTVSEYSKPQNS